jgi:hypothetical protein
METRTISIQNVFEEKGKDASAAPSFAGPSCSGPCAVPKLQIAVEGASVFLEGDCRFWSRAFPYRCEPMTFVRQTSTAVALITLSLWLQSVGMAALIGWARISLGPDTHKLGPLRSAVVMVCFTTAIIALHILQILLWARKSLIRALSEDGVLHGSVSKFERTRRTWL